MTKCVVDNETDSIGERLIPVSTIGTEPWEVQVSIALPLCREHFDDLPPGLYAGETVVIIHPPRHFGAS